MENGIVIEIYENSTAKVQLQNLGNCNSCPGEKSCDMFSKGDKNITVKFNGMLKKGDTVEIVFKPEKRIISSIIIFLLPIIALIGGYYIGFSIFDSEGYGTVFSISGLLITFFIIFIFLKVYKKSADFLPIAIKSNSGK